MATPTSLHPTKVTDARVAMKLYQMHKFQWEHTLKMEWRKERSSDQQTKWVPRGKRAQQKKRLQQQNTRCGVDSTNAGGGSACMGEPFNIMLHTDAEGP